MSKVEELREIIEAINKQCEKDLPYQTGLMQDIDALIAAATKEGCDEGWAATQMLWGRMTEWNKEWQKENPKERSLTWLDAIDLIKWKIATARAEGAERAKADILRPLVDRHWNSKADELREGIVGDLTQLAFLGGKHPEMSWGELRHKYGNPVVDSLIAAVRTEERALK